MMNVHYLKQTQAVGCWLVSTALLITLYVSLWVPLAVAESEQIDITLNANGHQTFDSLMQQAEVEASNAIAQLFATHPNITEVSIRIMGERNGQEVPLIFATVSRTDWQQDPRLQPWARYFGRSPMVLLGFSQPQGTDPNNPAAASTSPMPGFSPIEFRRQLEEDPAFRDD
jgi:hypothetical protein